MKDPFSLKKLNTLLVVITGDGLDFTMLNATTFCQNGKEVRGQLNSTKKK